MGGWSVELHRIIDAGLFCVAISADNSRLACGSADNMVRVWNAHDVRAVYDSAAP